MSITTVRTRARHRPPDRPAATPAARACCQSPNSLSATLLAAAGRDPAADDDLGGLRMPPGRAPVDQLVAGDARQRVDRGDRAVGRVAVEHPVGDHAGERARVLERDLQAVDRALALAVELVLRVAGVADHVGEDFARGRQVGGRRGQADESAVGAGAGAHLRAEAFERGGDLGRAARRRALVGDARGERRRARPCPPDRSSCRRAGSPSSSRAAPCRSAP